MINGNMIHKKAVGYLFITVERNFQFSVLYRIFLYCIIARKMFKANVSMCMSMLLCASMRLKVSVYVCCFPFKSTNVEYLIEM